VSSETFGAMLRRLRASQPGYTQGNRHSPSKPYLSLSDLAKRAGVDQTYLSMIEHEKRVPSRGVTLALAQVLGLDDDETDHFLFIAGWAPAEDWQTRALAAEAKLDMIRQTFDLPAELLIFRRRAV
jgi:transcriptional regulator with XRE-family HTH domain